MIKQSIFCVAMLLAMVITSCEKENDPEFKNFESPISVQFTIPTVANTTSEVSLSLNSLNYNVDSVVKANTNNNFNATAVNSIYISQIEVILSGADADNNVGNFETAKLNIISGTTPVTVGSASLTNAFATRATLQTTSNMNLKPYTNNNYINFGISGKARKATTHPLQAQLNATFRFEK